MKRKLEQDRIPGWKQSTAAQWAAIQGHALTLWPVSQRSGLWQADKHRGEGFTESLNLLLKNIAKKHQRILTDMFKAKPVAAIAVANTAPTRNDRKLSPSVRNQDVLYILIQLPQVSPVRGLSVSG